ncbi:bifunctional diguanylate cyclase/phosphodiesterase [Oceanicella sp. SM1341]|uniref:putative bifunctional diguanylate cyclase/phosphodiesterase n=1 Tax=Oceanicella sp. SM1341 TaxID=1548889 RepID=UPI000E533F86|nr:EAL domain-containing protein [Oceanicella sp. SM1341]
MPRPGGLSEAERLTLGDLAELVVARLEELRPRRAGADASRLRFEQVSSTSPDSIICVDEGNIIRFWNAGAERMFGYTAAEALGETLEIILPSSLHGRRLIGLARVAAGRGQGSPGQTVTLPALRRDGTEFPVELSLSRWEEGGRPVFGAILRDITDRRRAEAELRHAAEHDPLTGLANRALLRRRLEALDRSGRGGAAMVLDLDGFKHVNDVFGHSGGDQLLVAVAKRLVSAGEGALVARLGGDEFVLLLEGRRDPAALRRMAERVVALLGEAVPLENHLLHVGTSIGVACRAPGTPLGDLLGDADMALYRAKALGRGRVMFFDPQMRASSLTGGTLMRELHGAWGRGEFVLHFQPRVRLADGALAGAEALLRWNHPERGLLTPGAFLSGLDSSMLAGPVGDWVLETACRTLAAWRRRGFSGLKMSVNLFSAQLHGPGLAERVPALLRSCDLPARALELELNEASMLRNRQTLPALLGRLRAAGVGAVFDGFGTGLAPLRLLRDVPLQCLKIDRSAVSGDGGGLADPAMVEAVARLGSGLNLEVAAEGIETAGQAGLLLSFGCTTGQGALFGMPVSQAVFEAQHLGDSRSAESA